MSQRLPSIRRAHVPWILACLLWIACQPAPGPQRDPGAGARASSASHQGLSLDLATPSQFFDGGDSSLLLGDGWDVPQMEVVAGREVPYAWAVGDTASLWLAAAVATASDLIGECNRLEYPDAPPQVVRVEAAGRVLGERGLSTAGWQPLRVPLQDVPPPTAGPVRLDLHFAVAQRPKDILPDSADARRLAIACRHLAVVPRGADLPPAPSFDRQTGQLRLPLGTTVGWPVPARRRGRLTLRSATASCSTCPLRVVVSSPPREQELWRGTAAEIGNLSLPFTVDGPRPGRLKISYGEAADLLPGPAEGASPVVLELGSEALSFAEPQAPSSKRPHLFVYLIDTLRADLVEPYGAAAGTSPAIAAFAEDAVTYEAWSASAWTLPSVVSILTGAYPARHGVERGDTRFDDNPLASLAERLAVAGYDTVAVSQSLVASHRFGLQRGFERFYFSNQLNGTTQRSQDLRGYLTLDLLQRPHPQRPLFAYLHSVDPHAPYVPQGEDRRFAQARPGSLPADDYNPQHFQRQRLTDDAEVDHLRALYQGEVAYADRQFGRFIALLQQLGLYDDSLIVLLSDHGEEFADHGGFDHGRTPFEEMLRVPLLVKFPQSQGGGRFIDARVSTVDLVPTLLEAAEIDLPDALDGRPLPRQAADGRTRRRVIAANVSPAPRHGISVRYDVLAVGDLKCIHSTTGVDQFGEPVPPVQAFRLDQDPAERAPLEPSSDDFQRCRELLEQWQAVQSALQSSTEAPPTDEATRDSLRSLGYID